MGVGKVKIDSKWRVTIPAELREGLKPGDVLIVERRGNEIVYKPIFDALKEFNEIKLYAGKEKAYTNAEQGKHMYGGFKE